LIKNNLSKIISELSQASTLFDDSNLDQFVHQIITSRKIVCCGAGRMGYVSKAFSMRLSHLGLNSYYYQDSNLPHLSANDLLIIASGSGETITMLNLGRIAKKQNIALALITCNSTSSLAKIADTIISLNTPTKTDRHPQIKTIQAMTTLTEQFLFIFYDALVLELITKLKLSKRNLWQQHSNLE